MRIIPLDINRINELVELWNNEFSAEFPMRKELFIQNSFEDENMFLPGSCIAVNNEDHVIGFIISKRWQDPMSVPMPRDIGWIQVLVVSKKERNKGIGSLLLEKAETALKADGAAEIQLGGDPLHYFPSVPADYEKSAQWFEHKGYEYLGNEFDLLAHHDPSLESEFPVLDGVEIEILTLEDKDELLRFMNKAFPGRWEYETIRYFQKGGKGREFVVLKKEGKIIGSCRISDEQSPVIYNNVYWSPLFPEPLGGIGSVGIDSEERGKGYGLAAVLAGISILRSRGINKIVIDWTTIVDFYGQMGYQIWKEYRKYRKQL
ncbi:GNAT family N-acetyltransferase [Bacillus sp. FJAT-49732]|uniref:GNAT family N-acetyltransferase n=1 Tax=Lederbergia citrisecunda TaxID=2833583 RepID=A0A942TQ41_9BACI|nr:GNAT family N-acetyltransferase [Lederbergia citrisecunda]MBS4200832.1 GNAT family N-acetyltransferase [Lederbergia citrisecunda]